VQLLDVLVTASVCRLLDLTWTFKKINKLCEKPPQYASPGKLTIYSYLFVRWRSCSGTLAIWDISSKLAIDILTLKVVSESRVTWATSVPISVFLGLSVPDLGPMYATDIRRQTAWSPPPRGRGHNNLLTCNAAIKSTQHSAGCLLELQLSRLSLRSAN